MADTTVEIDFFQVEKQNGSPKGSSPEHLGSSCRRIQNVVSKITPVLLKTIMAAGAAPQARCADSIGAWRNGRPLQSSNLSSPSAVLDRASRSAVHGDPETALLTIFYNGTVAAFDVTSDKAEAIIRMAESGIVKNPAERPEDPSFDGHQVEGDLPIARRKSLQRFLEKRAERVK